ncbi:MAG: 3-hydroxyacyl-CoA dehydrogenase NAD-binding domain-containing protein, partial [Myxococcota bacterium]
MPGNAAETKERPERVAIVGAGTIGAAWAARFLLHGVDVAVHDAAPGAESRIARTLDRARAAWDGLDLPTAREGRLRFAATVEDAVAEATHVQESVPEDLPIKRTTFAAIERGAPPETVIASSTSGLRPTKMQEGLARPERLVVGHPFVPVYLIPLVEVVGGDATPPRVNERACATNASVSMKPRHVR